MSKNKQSRDLTKKEDREELRQRITKLLTKVQEASNLESKKTENYGSLRNLMNQAFELERKYGDDVVLAARPAKVWVHIAQMMQRFAKKYTQDSELLDAFRVLEDRGNERLTLITQRFDLQKEKERLEGLISLAKQGIIPDEI